MGLATEFFPEVGRLWKPCVVCTLAPAPLLVFVHSPAGRAYALMLFFVGAMGLVAYSFRRDLAANTAAPQLDLTEARHLWRVRIASLAIALAIPLLVFTFLSVLVNNPFDYGTPQGMAGKGIWWRAFLFDTPRDFTAPILAALTVAAAICIVPYWVLATKRTFAAVVFSTALVGLMKLLGCLIVVLIYGWDSDAQGRLYMPWNHPNLLVWLFFGLSTLLAVSCFVAARRRFIEQYCPTEPLGPHHPSQQLEPVVRGV